MARADDPGLLAEATQVVVDEFGAVAGVQIHQRIRQTNLALVHLSGTTPRCIAATLTSTACRSSRWLCAKSAPAPYVPDPDISSGWSASCVS